MEETVDKVSVCPQKNHCNVQSLERSTDCRFIISQATVSVHDRYVMEDEICALWFASSAGSCHHSSLILLIFQSFSVTNR